MKGPVECVAAEGEVERNEEFEEYMWMADEDLEDFDKKVEEELHEELRMHQALDEFEEQQEAALYAQEGLRQPAYPPPRHFIGPDPAGFSNWIGGIHVNGHGPAVPSAASAAAAAAPVNLFPAAAPAANAAQPEAATPNSAHLNSAPSFTLNPNAPVFVPRWAAPSASSEHNSDGADSSGVWR